VAEGNGVPRWVEERLSALDGRLREQEDRIEKLAEKLQATRENLSNLLGKFAIISAAIGAATAALFTLLIRLLTG
jgi:uncharacterized coiled-coil protein SlyX